MKNERQGAIAGRVGTPNASSSSVGGGGMRDTLLRRGDVYDLTCLAVVGKKAPRAFVWDLAGGGVELRSYSEHNTKRYVLSLSELASCKAVERNWSGTPVADMANAAKEGQELVEAPATL